MIVGTAELLVTANTAGLDAEIAAGSDASFATLKGKASKAGQDAGDALSMGVGAGAAHIADDAAEHVEENTSKMKSAFNDLGEKARNSLSGFGIPQSLLKGPAVVAILGAAVTAYSVVQADALQKGDAAIAASEGISVKAATNIGDAMLDTGGKVEFSAKDQATAFATIADQMKTTEGKALSTSQTMQVMNASMRLATATGEDLGTTTSALASVMQAFKLPVSDSAKAANTLFVAAGATGQSVETLGTALENTRSKLGATSPSMAALAALMIDMTKNGVTGRSALTGLNTAMTALQGAATGTSTANKTAKQTLADYGLSAKQANGQLTPLSTIISTLGPKYATMTQAQQLQTSSLIFGSAAAKQMTAVIAGGVTSYQQSITAVNNHTAAQKAAAIQSSTLSGEEKILGADVQDVAAKFGQVLVPILGGVVRAVVPVIGAFVDVIGWFEKGGTAARVLEGVIAVVLLPSILKIGTDAVTATVKAIGSFVTMGTDWAATGLGIKATTAGVDSSIVGVGAATTETAAVVETETVAMSASFTAMLGPIAAVAAAILGLKTLSSHVNILGETNSQSALQAKYDQMYKGVKTPTQLKDLNESTSKFASLMGWTVDLKKSVDANTAALNARGIQKAGIKDVAKGRSYSGDDFIAPPNTTAIKAEAHKKKVEEEDAKKAAEAAKEAGSKAASASKAAAATLTSEVIKAISLPASEAAKSLKALGVPANKASAVLKDAVLPFSQAITALEKAGFDASDAVRIAEAGRAEVLKAQKAAAAAATKAATDSVTTIGALMVNGIAVSGSVYRAAIGAAYQVQTGQSITAPTGKGGGQSINIQSGAVVIHPAAGNDSNSLAQTRSMIEDAFRQLAVQLRGGRNGLAVVR